MRSNYFLPISSMFFAVFFSLGTMAAQADPTVCNVRGERLAPMRQSTSVNPPLATCEMSGDQVAITGT